MKMKKEYVVLVGIIAVLLVFLVLSGRKGRMGYEIPRLDSLAKTDIDRIELRKGEREIILQGKEGEWTVLPQDYPADTDRVDRMLETISGLTLTELAAEKGDYLRYELDEDNRIKVKAFKGEDIVRVFDIGKTSPTYRHTFVRIDEDRRVFHARESFRSAFDYDVDDLRDKSVLKFDKNEISGISLIQEGLDLSLTKTVTQVPAETEEKAEEQETPPAPTEVESWMTEDGKKGNKTELESLLSQVYELKCDKFIEGKTKENFEEPIFQVTLKGAKDYVLLIYAKDETEDKYPAVSSENAYPFYLSAYKGESIMKEPAKWLEAE